MSLIDLCTSCGKDYPVDELTDGVCMLCLDGYDDSDRVPLDFDQLYQQIDKTGDCV